MKKKSDIVIHLIVTIHPDDTQSVEVEGTGDGSTGPMDTLWSDLESGLRGGLMERGVIDTSGIGDWEV